MSAEKSINKEEKALEILEHLARHLISSEAEKVAAMGCTNHLQNLLCNIPPVERAEAGVSVRCPSICENKAKLAQFPVEADKENAPPMQSVMRKSCVPDEPPKAFLASPHKLCNLGEVQSCVGAQNDELQLQAQLSAMAHSTGRLRAQCARQQEQVQQLQVDLVQARDLLTKRAAESISLRECSAEFIDELKQRNAMLSEMTQRSADDASATALQMARSELREWSSELSELGRRTDMLERHRVLEARAFQEEAKERADEQVALQCASERVQSELHSLSEMLKQEENHVRKLRNEEENNLIQLQEMGLHISQCTSVQLEEQCCAWKREVEVQRAEIEEFQKHHAAAQAVHIENQAHTEEVVAEKMTHLRSRSEVSASELADMRAAMLSQQDCVAGEQQLCMRLAARLKSKDRSLKRWRQENHQPKDQKQVLKTIEQRLKMLQSTLAKGGMCTKKSTSTQAVQEPRERRPSPQSGVADVPLGVCREEAARILGSAAPRLGVAGDGHAGDQAGGSALPCHGDLPCLANATREAVQVIREQLVRLLARLRASLLPRALTSIANHDTLTVRALLCELRETLRMSSLNLQDTSADLRYCNEQMQTECPSRHTTLRNAEESNFDMVSLATIGARPSPLEDFRANPAMKASATPRPAANKGASAEMVPPTTLASASGPWQASRQRAISYPESLAGSPACQRGVLRDLDLLKNAVPSAKWAPEEERCIEEFLEACRRPMSHPAQEPVLVHAPSAPVLQAPVPQYAESPSLTGAGSPNATELPHAESPSATLLPHAESPGAFVRRARGRLRELRLGLARPLRSCIQAEVCSPQQFVPQRSASMPLLLH